MGLRPKASARRNTDEPWIDRAGDARRFGKVAGDRGNTGPPLLLANQASLAPFNDQTQDHHWEILPALDRGSRMQRQTSICASMVLRHQNLADNKGTICFLEMMQILGQELFERLGDDYYFTNDWRNRWWDIIEGSKLVRFKFCWSHAQYEICEQYWPWTADWWRVVPTPLRVKITRGSRSRSTTTPEVPCYLAMSCQRSSILLR